MKGIYRVLLAVSTVLWLEAVYAAQDDVRIAPDGRVEADRDTGTAADQAAGQTDVEKWFTITLENSIHYDTNPEVTSDNEEDDWGDIIKLSVSGRFYKKDNVECGGQYAFYGEFYGDVEERNLEGHTIGLYLVRVASPVSLRLDYQFSHYLLDGESYLRKHSVIPMAFWATGQKTLEMIRLGLSANDYPEEEDQEGSDISLHLRHFYFVDAEKRVRFSVGYKLTSTDADDNDADNVAHRYASDIRIRSQADLTVLVRVAYTSRHYRGSRDDEKLGYRLELIKPLDKNWSITFGLDSTNNNSDDALSDYQRNIGFVSFKGVF